MLFRVLRFDIQPDQGARNVTEKIKDGILDSYHFGKMDRRTVLKRAAAAGVSASTLSILATSGVTTNVAAAAAPAMYQAADGLLTTNNFQGATWIRNFNPLLSENSSHLWPSQNGIYEPLFVYSTTTGELIPWLATEWSWNEDSTQLTFTIRDGIQWSDGTPFTASDVAFTFNLIKQHEALPANGGRVVADLLASIEVGGASGSPEASPAADGTPAAGGNTVVFTFSEVNTLALFDIGGQSIVPEHIFGAVDDPVTFTNENPVGTGPFTEVARFEDQIWELHKNPNYWQEGLPLIEGLRMPAFVDNAAINLATINGEMDWVANFIADIEETFVARDPEHFHYWFPATGATVHLYLNTTVAPFDNVDVRKAISMALNRDQIVSIAMYDYTHPADSTGLSDAYEAWKDPASADLPWVKQDVDAANALLDSAGFTRDGDWRKLPDGTTMSYELNVVSGWSDWVQSCDIMAQNLAEIGVQATVKPYDQTTWTDRVQNGEFTMSIGWAAGGPTPYNFYRGIMSSETYNPIGTSSGENWHRFQLPEADEALAAMAATSDEAEQKAAVATLQALYAEHAPAVPLFPGPQWGEYTTLRFEGFPNEDDPYGLLSTYAASERLLVMTKVKPVAG
jgi:peptide/nickel transport system substrate-binding protein